MNTREENVDEMMREANEIERKQQFRRADLEWALQWHNGCAHCPSCRGTEFSLADLASEGQLRYKTMSCKTCGARWKVAYRESAVVIVRDQVDQDDEWIELPAHPLRFSEQEAAAVLAALRYWRREGPSSAGHERDIETNFGRLQPLSAEQIDALCERIRQSPEAGG